MIRSQLLLGVALFAAPLVAPPANAQVTIQIGGGVGVMSPTADFGGSTIDYYFGQRYGLSSGITLQGKARVGLLGITLAGEIAYASLSNDGNSEPGQGRVEVSQKILSFKFGPEFHLHAPLVPFTPYAGANIAINRFSGETTFQGVSKVPSAVYSVQSASRFGIGITGGVLVKISPLVSLDAGLAYNLMNIGGKGWEDVNPFQEKRIDSYLALNDANDPLFQPGNDDHIVGSDRTINSFQVSVSVLFRL